MNYFVKILLLKSDSPILLYGFCAPTNNQIYSWRQKKLHKKIPIIQYTAVFNSLDKDDFVGKISSNATYHFLDIDLDFSFVARPEVLSDIYGMQWQNNKPVAGLHVLEEYWCLDKRTLLSKIEMIIYKNLHSAKEKRNQITIFFDILKVECGIDFSTEGGRLGNFECYTPAKFLDFFEIRLDEEQNIVIDKKKDINEDLYVNCASENVGQWIADDVKIFSHKDKSLGFIAYEPMTHYKIKIWSVANGTLVYANECAFIAEVSINGSIVTHRNIQDPWTKELHKSAEKHKNEIEKIENQVISSRQETITVVDKGLMPWRQAKIEGDKIFGVFKIDNTKGAFFPKGIAKKGEIDSFLKVQSYISEQNVTKALLVDPYFSIKSMAKLLGRISSSNLELNIITALTDTDPDTNKKIPDVKQECINFLEANKNILHPKLKIYNVLRGRNQAFHDRYLIRFFKNSSVDGFLLSNSLNSAGQSFPFVIAPFEKEVCLDVIDYVNTLIDIEFQDKLPPNEKATIEIIFDNDVDRQKELNQSKEYILPFMLTGDKDTEHAIEKCIEIGFLAEGSTAERFSIPPEQIPRIIPLLFDQWDNHYENVTIAIGEVMYHSYNVESAVKSTLESLPNACTKLIEVIPKLSKEMEARQKHSARAIHSEQYQCWMLLNEQAKAGKIELWFNRYTHIYYDSESYWSSLYKLLFLISRESFLHIMSESSSPLMLSTLLCYLLFYDFDTELYHLLLGEKWSWINDLVAEWIWHKYQEHKVNINEVLDTLSKTQQLYQSVYILSRATFYKRTSNFFNSECNEEEVTVLSSELIERIASICNMEIISNEIKINALKQISDCEETSDSFLKYSLAELLQEKEIRKFLLDRVINIFTTKKTNDHLLPFSQEKNSDYIDILVNTIILRRENDSDEFIYSKILSRSSLQDYTEPYLRDRDYTRWNKSKIIIGWEIPLVTEYKKKKGLVSENLERYLAFITSAV